MVLHDLDDGPLVRFALDLDFEAVARTLAEQLRHRLGVVYSSTERFDSVNTRWRGQIAENAKSLAFGHVLPEMNHNELVGWKVLKEQMQEMQVFFLRDKQDHRRTKTSYKR